MVKFDSSETSTGIFGGGGLGSISKASLQVQMDIYVVQVDRVQILI
jgi:hypothetical protein